MAWLEEQRRRRARAAKLYADPAIGLAARARQAWRGGFTGGAEWMRVALGAARGGAMPRGEAAFAWLGARKYGACCAGAIAAALGAAALGAGWAIAVPIAIVAFYLIEVQFVFLFPVALDHGTPAWRRARKLVQREGGTLRALFTVLPIAWRMLSGGVRGWCCGCLEVLLWYEDARSAGGAAPASRLILGDGGPLQVREERVTVANLRRPVRIAWISDLHLVRRSSILTVRSVIRATRAARPDVIVLGGDLVDGERGLRQLAGLVRALTRIAPVWALPGNHDERFGVPCVAATVRAMGGAWLPGVVASVADGTISLVAGEKGPSNTTTPGVTVACLHMPAYAERWRSRAHVVLAGHLHGGQLAAVWWWGRSWPCAILFRWCGPRFDLGQDTTLIVGSGAADLLPVRWCCPREIVCVDIVPKEEGHTQHP